MSENTPLGGLLGRIAIVVASFAVAWLATRLAGRIAAYFIDRGRGVTPEAGTAVMDSLKQRETAVSLVQTTVRYVFFGLALLFSILIITGAREIGAVVGASFLAVVAAFAAQRFLMDVIAGLLMFLESWFKVGDTIAVEPNGGEGVVEEVALRYTTLRAANGDVVRINNSTIAAAHVTPRGRRELDIELFASDEERGRRLVENVARIVPAGPVHFIRRPQVEEAERLDEDLVRIRARTAVAPGREWLAQELLPDLVKERAGEDLLIHGPVVTTVDDHAARRYARAAYADGEGRSRSRHSRLSRLREATGERPPDR